MRINNPMSEKELNNLLLVQPGKYQFQVVGAQDKVSKSGNEMIELNIKIWDAEGRERFLFDYLLESMAFKLRHFCEAVGLLDKYNQGNLLASDCIGKSGNLELVIQKDKTGLYGDKNAVKDYIIAIESIAPKKAANDFIDSDIPF